MNDNRYRNQSIASFTLMVMILGIFIVLITLFLVEDKFKDVAYSNFGSFINGITAPIIGVIVGLLTFLAFKMQVDANRQVQKQFELQQFESQFYELLRLHKENVNEMVIQGYVYEGGHRIEREIKGRKIFVTNITEFLSLIKIIDIYSKRVKTITFGEQENILLSYNIFFYGLSAIKRNVFLNKHPYLKQDISDIERQFYTDLINILKNIQTQHTNGNRKKCKISFLGLQISFKSEQKIRVDIKYKPYAGHLSRYGHYYRNLILIVKHIVDNEELKLTYEKRRSYLRILRAQLTAHEQFLLFLNWYSGIGSQWEKDVNEKSVKEDDNKFLTDYRMIHNINIDIIDDNTLKWEDIIKEKFKNSTDFKYLNEKDKKLFEVIKGISSSQEEVTK